MKKYLSAIFSIFLSFLVLSPLLAFDKTISSKQSLKNGSVSRFKTGDDSFDENYATLAHHQDSFNAGIIEKLSDSVRKWFPHTLKAPIRILDLCCGDGKPTYDLLIKLTQKGVNVSKIEGYDISAAQIEQAISKYKHDPRIEFAVKNVENLEVENQYDLITCFFGLHWMEDIKKVAPLIAKALKPGGKLMFFVPLEKKDLYEFRCRFIAESHWSKYFKDYKLYPFIEDEGTYIKAFDPYFEHEAADTKRGKRQILYTEDEFVSFLSSWMQDLRHLKSQPDCSIEASSNYVKEMVRDMPAITEGGNIRKLDDNKILFTEHFFSYQGSVRGQ